LHVTMERGLGGDDVLAWILWPACHRAGCVSAVASGPGYQSDRTPGRMTWWFWMARPPSCRVWGPVWRAAPSPPYVQKCRICPSRPGCLSEITTRIFSKCSESGSGAVHCESHACVNCLSVLLHGCFSAKMLQVDPRGDRIGQVAPELIVYPPHWPDLAFQPGPFPVSVGF
jgi:hypothetical protein